MMSGIEDVIGAEVWRALDEATRYRCAKAALLHVIIDPPRLVEPRRTLGLERLVSGIVWEGTDKRVPFGWTMTREFYHDACIFAPWWLVAVLAPWRARWRLYRFAMKLGLWDAREGDLYSAGWLTWPRPIARFLWCFVNDRDEYRGSRMGTP